MKIHNALVAIVKELGRNGYHADLAPSKMAFDDNVVVSIGTGAYRTTATTKQQPPMTITIARFLKVSGQRRTPRTELLAAFVDVDEPKSIAQIFANVDKLPDLGPGVAVQPLTFSNVSEGRYLGVAVECRLTIVR